MEKFRLRFLLAVVILAISLVMLAWSFLPGERIVHRQQIQPTEMQLPTPSSFIPLDKVKTVSYYSNATTHINNGSERFLFID